MDSKQNNSIVKSKKQIKFLVKTILTITILNGIWVNLRVYAYDNSEATYKSKIPMPIFSELITDMTWISEYNAGESENFSLTNSKNLKDKVAEFLNLKVDGYKIVINNEVYGYVANKDERELIVQSICNNYIEQLGVEFKDIIQIGLVSEIEAIPCKINYEDIRDNSEIANKIFGRSIEDKDLLGIKITVKSSELDKIEPSLVTESTEELYMGELKKVEGSEGIKMISKENVFDGLTKVSEYVVSEDILVEPKPTVIKKGAKNPYDDGIAFLSMPTMGGYMSSEYGEQRYSSYHKGIDIAKDLGDDVKATFDGKVITSGYNDGGYGNLIVIEHENNMTTYYAHLHDIHVNIGDVIKKGEKIGTVGSTGLSTGPHLHFELRINGEPVDPTPYIVGL